MPTASRGQRLERALFRGAALSIENPAYVRAVRTFIQELLLADLSPRDLTVDALRLGGTRASARIIARETGIVAGLQECALLMRENQVNVEYAKQDGDAIAAGEALLRLEGDRGNLLSLERVALNVIQRMSGIASTTRRLGDRVRSINPGTRVVGTRKTPWGLLDKRALHAGGAGTHRIGLGDAILIKNNHLALLANSEDQAARAAIEQAWNSRNVAAFIEVEVRTNRGAIAAAETYRNLRERDGASDYPCLLMLDNMDPSRLREAVHELQRAKLWDSVLIEASGGISEVNIEAYAATGVDAISVGALTHSPRALDVSETISSS
ncbi:MAG TPA: carboxylating nicotinate-nucleotide diphosphorylase [Candidatus Acidoferrales bacterium]|nr:carboxylating nicotinate-nucleotide diphosphorylase [Candidatus Acidoferrales bacterium]